MSVPFRMLPHEFYLQFGSEGMASALLHDLPCTQWHQATHLCHLGSPHALTILIYSILLAAFSKAPALVLQISS